MGPRSHLVEVQLPALHEILDSQNPRITAPAHERLALFDEPGPHGIVHARGRHDAQVEDAVAVDVLPYRETHDSLAVVHHDDARLVIERHELLQNGRYPQIGFRPGDILRSTYHRLSVPVISQRPRFEDTRIAYLENPLHQRFAVVHLGETGHAQAVVAGIGLLPYPVLRIEQRPVALRNIVPFGQGNEYLSRNVLEFVGHYIAAAAQLLQRGGIVESGHDMVVAHPKGRCIRRRIEANRPCPEHGGLLGYHQPQLSAAYDSYGLHPLQNRFVVTATPSSGPFRSDGGGNPPAPAPAPGRAGRECSPPRAQRSSRR